MQSNYSVQSKPDEKLIIIPDIHNKHNIAEKIIQKESPDRVIFLGDYFDDFGDTPEDAGDTARWLTESLQEKNRIHLIGNHDLNYITDNPDLRCSGYDSSKHKVIREYGIKWDRLKLYFWVDGWLLTHAGLSNKFYQEISSRGPVKRVMEEAVRDIEDMEDTDRVRPFLQAGILRGGTSPVGGIVWCDYREFEDIPGVRQIFGHTRDVKVRHRARMNSEHYCIDTQLNHYITCLSGVMHVVSV